MFYHVLSIISTSPEITNGMLPNQVWGHMVTKKKSEPSWNLQSEMLRFGVLFSDGAGGTIEAPSKCGLGFWVV